MRKKNSMNYDKIPLKADRKKKDAFLSTLTSPWYVDDDCDFP